MADKDDCKSVFDKIYDCVHSGVNWTTVQIKSACPHKRRKSEESIESGKARDEIDRISPSITPKTSPETSPERSPGRSPGKSPKRSPGKSPERSPETSPETSPEASPESSTESSPKTSPKTSPKRSPYVPPPMCPPSAETCCYIKMQDPCRPCCCEAKPKPLPCPPKDGPQEPREPMCGCDLCQRNPNHEKCCDKNRTFRGITIDRGHFEKA